MHELVGQLNLPPHVIPVAQNLQILNARVHPGISHPGEESGHGISGLNSNIVKFCTRPPKHHTDRQLVRVLREVSVPGNFIEN